MLADLVKKGGIRAVAVGNGTAGRETETFVREALRHFEIDVPVVMVSEAGASVYSASDVAREEFPDLDVTVRGAISIARRLQDPLAELVKIDPKSIGVGQYQHDVSADRAQEEPRRGGRLLREPGRRQPEHRLVSPAGARLGHRARRWRKAIVEHRAKAGLFKSRDGAAGGAALREEDVRAGGGLPARAGAAPARSTTPAFTPSATRRSRRLAAAARASRSGRCSGPGVEAGEAGARAAATRSAPSRSTTSCRELEKPGRDPRETFVPFSFRADIHELKDLQPGMVCPGIVTNVTNFGAFVDIGVHQDGLVHISQLSDKFVKDPREVVSAGDRVTVRVLEVKLDKKQIALTMKSQSERAAASERPAAAPGGQPPAGRPAKSPGGPPTPPKPATPFNNPFAAALANKNPRR